MVALDDTYEGDDVVSIEGTAELFNDPAVTPLMPTYVAKYAGELAEMEMSAEKMASEYTQAIRITPTKLY